MRRIQPKGATRLALLPIVIFLGVVPGETLVGQTVPPSPETTWDGSRLEPGIRRYDALLLGERVGSAEYRLERDGTDWVSIATVSAGGSSQQSRLRFRVADLAARSLVQESLAGPFPMRTEVHVEGGRLIGTMELPSELGGNQTIDELLPARILLGGMDEYALAVSPLADRSHFVLPYFDLLSGSVVELEIQVLAEVDVSVPAGDFATWRVEVSGGANPVILYLRRAPPHILIRQESPGNPLRLDLAALTSP